MSEDTENSQEPESDSQRLTAYLRKEIVDKQRKDVMQSSTAIWVFTAFCSVFLTLLVLHLVDVLAFQEELSLWKTLLFVILAGVGVMAATFAVHDHAIEQEGYAFISELPDSYFINGSNRLKLLRALAGIDNTDKTRTAIMVELCLLGPADTQQD